MNADMLLLAERAWVPAGFILIAAGAYQCLIGQGWIARLCGLALAQAGALVLLAGAGAGAAAAGFAILSAVTVGCGAALVLRVHAAGGKVAVEPHDDDPNGSAAS